MPMAMASIFKSTPQAQSDGCSFFNGTASAKRWGLDPFPLCP